MSEPLYDISFVGKKKVKASRLEEPVDTAVLEDSRDGLHSSLKISPNVAPWEKEFHELSSRLMPLNLSLMKIEADGNCLFRAFALQLTGSEDGHSSLRKECVDYMQCHSADFAPFLDEGVSLASYCAMMRRPEMWGGQPEIQALSVFKGVNVFVFQGADEGTVEMTNFEDENIPLVILSYHSKQKHYNAIIPSYPTAPSFITLSKLKELLKPPPPPPPPAAPVMKKKSKLFSL